MKGVGVGGGSLLCRSWFDNENVVLLNLADELFYNFYFELYPNLDFELLSNLDFELYSNFDIELFLNKMDVLLAVINKAFF
jgi:hypothetical protein